MLYRVYLRTFSKFNQKYTNKLCKYILCMLNCVYIYIYIYIYIYFFFFFFSPPLVVEKASDISGEHTASILRAVMMRMDDRIY
jgi:hypothetical protein